MSLILHSTPDSLAAQRSIDIAVREAQRLVTRFDSHAGRNDFVAVKLQQALCQVRGSYDEEAVALCLNRLRIAAEARKYPTELP